MNKQDPGLMLSAIVISINSPAVLKRCLAALKKQAVQEELEIIVVRNQDKINDEYVSIKSDFSGINWLTTPSSCTVPQMRCMGMSESHSEIVALLEDDCIVDANWKSAVMTAHRQDFIAIGGAVEPGNYNRVLDWAVYFCEYVRFMLPLPRGDVDALAGNNVSYKRIPLQDMTGDLADSGFYDVFIHWQLKQAGQNLKSDPSVIVYNENSWTWKHILNVPFNHGRGFAAMRVKNKKYWQKIPYVGIALLLPLIQISRIFAHLVKRRRYILKFFQALPWIVMFSISWSAGELVGYLSGLGWMINLRVWMIKN